MKVAVCIGGLLKGKAEKNIEIMKKIFPYDFFLSTWDTVEKFSPFENIKTYKEPKALDEKQVYHPNKNRINVLRHGCKQIIAHAHMLSELNEKYDMIIRTRYDLRINEKIDWNNLLKLSYSENIPIGIASPSLQHFNKIEKIIYGDKGSKTTVLGGGLNDHIIFHRRILFNSDKIFELERKNELRIGEFGWWQTLVKENFGDVSHENDPCHNYIGGVVIDRHLVE
jgi:hypothetical protein